jgi:hypothetical protein
MSVKRLVAFVLCLSLCLQQSYLYAQDKSKAQFGKVSPADFVLPASPLIDSNTHGIVLLDLGDIHFVGNEHGWFSYVFKVQQRIKIIDKEAFHKGTVRFYLHNQDDREEKLTDFDATTYNLENGRIVETKLAKNDLFKERQSKYWTEVKFTMPAVKAGSIIEYTYTKTSPFYRDLPGWNFQSVDEPRLWSELNVEIPQTLSYAVIKQGIHAFDIDKAATGSQTYKVVQKVDNLALGAGADERSLFVSTATIKHRWVMKDMPAFHVENYISAPGNYIDKLQFQLAGTYNGEEKEEVKRTWKGATDEWLGNSFYFGPMNEDNDWLDDLVNQATAKAGGQLAQAQAIFYYISGHFSCTNYDDPFVRVNMREVVQKHSGSVGGINMLMLAMLRKEHIPSDPILLSTTDHGFNFTKYPIEDRMNYTIVRALIDGKVYFLDATHSRLAFGRLADNCYNGPARIISNEDSGFVNFNPDSLKENSTTMVIISNSDKGGLEGSYQKTMGLQESYETREEISRIGEKKYFDFWQTQAGEDFLLSNMGVDSLKLLEDPVAIHFDFAIKQGDDNSMIYFTPMLADTYKNNPFRAAERKYPVEMPYCIHSMYLLNMDIPAGYKVEELPKSVKVALNGDEGAFEYLISSDGKSIQLRAQVQLNRAIFPPEDYSSLRDFFGYIVKKESEQIVLKKK